MSNLCSIRTDLSCPNCGHKKCKIFGRKHDHYGVIVWQCFACLQTFTENSVNTEPFRYDLEDSEDLKNVSIGSELVCPTCGKTFIKKSKMVRNQKYCTPQCNPKNMRKGIPNVDMGFGEYTCQICKKQFFKQHPFQVVCSIGCYDKYTKKINKELKNRRLLKTFRDKPKPKTYRDKSTCIICGREIDISEKFSFVCSQECRTYLSKIFEKRTSEVTSQ